MDKQEILRGMKMTRMVADRINEEKYLTREEFDSGTGVTGTTFYIGTTEPEGDNVLWLDTSEFETGE